MNKPVSVRVLGVALGVVLFGQGCFGTAPKTPTGPDGGVFKSVDRGTVWAQKRILIDGTKALTIANDVIVSLALDPQDRTTIYAGTQDRGLIVSRDGGDSWQPFKGLNKGRIESVAVDPKDKCTVYAAQGNKIFKTINCGLDWVQAWFDPKTDKVFTVVLIDWFNPTIVYAGSSQGDILKSTDAGMNWLVAKRADAAVSSIAIDPGDSRRVYVSTRGDGIWKTMDGGNTWISIEKQLTGFDNARRPSQVIVNPLDTNMLFQVSKYGILVSKDLGETWTAMQLTNPPNSVEIRSLALNPRNDKELSYVTSNTLMVSTDGGVTWNAKKLPSARIANVLIADPDQANTLYLGMGPAPKQ